MPYLLNPRVCPWWMRWHWRVLLHRYLHGHWPRWWGLRAEGKVYPKCVTCERKGP